MEKCWEIVFLSGLLFTEFFLMTLQADHKLSYALKHCNRQSEANIRFGSCVLAATIMHLRVEYFANVWHLLLTFSSLELGQDDIEIPHTSKAFNRHLTEGLVFGEVQLG